ncbi:hypothetical protein ACFQ22_14025 [Lentilactobacillus raoultii]|uniref:Bacterial Pleckstrin homology domain-containing protein n=1 Tax=Lentilactobacillus raoultii TaxID=1987503 RepID=A0ABW3PMA5_9LACO|nr:hypothetical protein [Lentilactobacillus raoultii]
MNQIKFVDKQLMVTISGLDRLWGFKSRLQLPLIHVSEMAVESRSQLKRDGKWRVIKWRLLGLGLPKKQVGTFYGNRKLSYLNVQGDAPILFIRLNHEKYDYLFLTVNDPMEILRKYQQLRRP